MNKPSTREVLSRRSSVSEDELLEGIGSATLTDAEGIVILNTEDGELAIDKSATAYYEVHPVDARQLVAKVLASMYQVTHRRRALPQKVGRTSLELARERLITS